MATSKNLNDFLISKDSLSNISNVERKRFLQKIKIIRYLFLNGHSTNADICAKFNISLPTSMSLITSLIEKGIVEKTGQGKSEGGRKPDLFGLKELSFFVLGIHIKRHQIKIAITDNNHSIFAEEITDTDISQNSNIVDLLYKKTQALIKSSGIEPQKLLGIGISMPGLVSTNEGKNFTYYLTEQEPESLQDKFEKKFKKPVVILNDTKSACLAEYRFGIAKGKKNVLVISMDWGIGLGIIMGGKMQTGHSGFAGEFGHIPMVEDGLLCHCGKRGCLETEASGLALVRKAKEGLKKGQTSILNEIEGEDLEKMNPGLIIQAANKGDQFAINLLSEIGINLGKGIAILIQIFNPELIILESEIAQAKQFITTPIQQSTNTYCMMQLKEKTDIKLSTLGSNSSLFGATIAVMEDIFQEQVAKLKAEP